MISSLSKLNSLMEPGESYVWHAPLAWGSPGVRPARLWKLALEALLTILVTSAIAAVAGSMMLSSAQYWVPASFGFFLVLGCIVIPLGLALSVAKWLNRPQDFLVITDKRAIELNSKMKILAAVPIAHLQIRRHFKTHATITATTENGDVTWLCMCNPDHISHLSKAITNQETTDRPKLSY